MTLQRTAIFIADVERQYEWYAVQANFEIAERYLDAVEATCALAAVHPRLGPLANCGIRASRIGDFSRCCGRFSVV